MEEKAICTSFFLFSLIPPLLLGFPNYGLPYSLHPCIPVLIRTFLVSSPSLHINHSLSMALIVPHTSSFNWNDTLSPHYILPRPMAMAYIMERWT